MMIFALALKGYKRKMDERVGVPVSNSRVPNFQFQVHRVKLPSSCVLWCILAGVSQEFLHSSEIMCLVLCFIAVEQF